MSTLLIIVIALAATAFGVYCGWSAYLRRTTGPLDGALVWRFVFLLWIVVSCFVVMFIFTPESYRDWLVIPLMIAGLTWIFWFRSRRRQIQSEESFLDPKRRDGYWIKKVR